MKSFKTFLDEVSKSTGGLKDTCWSGYTAVGMKMKNGRKVPNCVPTKEEVEDIEEVSSELLDRYKEKAKKSAAQLSAAGKYRKSTDRWMNIMKATGKQIDKTTKAIHKSLTGEEVQEVEELDEKTAAWKRKEGKSEAGGLNKKGIASYRREHPGSKLSMAVTTPPSKLKPGSKAANRRKSFCARMSGMKKRLTSTQTAKDPDSRINKALRKWNC